MRAALSLIICVAVACGLARAADEVQPVEGPKTICLRWSYFDLAQGERIIAFFGGFHDLQLSVHGAHGTYKVLENNIVKMPKLGRLLDERPGTRIYEAKDGRGRYVLIGRIVNFDDNDRPLIFLDGDAFDGSARDADIYRRFSIGDVSKADCDYGYLTGVIEE